jgi:EmrB/QacA subfamily drug resistance transporter
MHTDKDITGPGGEGAATRLPPDTPVGRVAPDGQAALDGRRWFALAVVLVAAFMDLLDVTIVNVAIPSIQHGLHASYSGIQWVAAGYSLAFAAGLITGGRLGDIYGRKRIFLIGITGFTIASVLSGVATDPGMLIGARIFQGLMAALMVPQILAIIHVTFPPAERGKVFGMYGAIAGSAMVAGPVIGGLLIQGNVLSWGWRPIFLVNLPVGVAGVIAAALYIRESKAPVALRIDTGGMLLATAAVLLLIYPLTEGRDLGWPAWTFVMMAGSAVVTGVFVWYERRMTARGRSPLIALSLFRVRSFTSGFGINLVFNLVTGGFLLMWMLFLQEGLGWTPLHAGLTALPYSISLAAGAAMSVQFLTPKFGRTVLIAGGLIMAVGAVVFMGTVSRYGAAIHSWQMGPALLVLGAGLGLIVAPLVDFALTGVPHESAGAASGVINMSWQAGTSIGIALISVVFLSVLGSQAGSSVAALAPQIRHELSAAGIQPHAQDQILISYRTCARDRAAETDPTVVPPSCDIASPAGTSPAQAAAIARIATVIAPRVQALAFAGAFRNGLRYVLGVMLLVTAMMFALPRRAKPQQPEGQHDV